MKRSLTRVLAFGALIWTAASPRAQAPSTAIFDPPETEYFNGAKAPDPAVERGLPSVSRRRAFLPVSVDLTARMPAVGDQGKSSSCAAWAAAYAARSYYTSALEGRDVQTQANLPSPSYIYHLAREGSCDDGTNIPRVVQVLKRGALSLAEHPYQPDCVPPASSPLVARARDFRVTGLRRIDLSRIDDIKGQLAQSNPVIIRLQDSQGFHRHRGAGTFAELPSDPNIKFVGWHFVTTVGYDDRRQALRIINSWGRGWGDQGYAFLGYDVVRTRVTHAYVLDVPRPPTVVAEQPPRPPTPPAPPKLQPIPSPPAPSKPQAMPPAPAPGPTARLSDLSNLPCGRIFVQSRDGRNILSGYVATEEDLNLVKFVAVNVPHTRLGEVVVAPWPQCEALQTLETSLAAEDRPSIDIGAQPELRRGDTLTIKIRPPSQISFLYVAYVQADGSLVHLVQPKGLVPQPTLPGQTLIFGDGREGRQKFTISPPFGREMIIAIASRSPLFADELPATQTEREYLSELRRALIYKPSPDMPDREVAAAIIILQTRAR